MNLGSWWFNSQSDPLEKMAGVLLLQDFNLIPKSDIPTWKEGSRVHCSSNLFFAYFQNTVNPDELNQLKRCDIKVLHEIIYTKKT